MCNVLLIISAVLVTICLPAYAYIDPGSGSAIVSLIIGFFVALGLMIKTYWYKLKALFTRQTLTDDNPEPEAEKSETDSDPFQDLPGHSK